MGKLDSAEYRMLEALIEQRRRLTQENLHLMERCGMQGTHNLQKEILKAEIAKDFRRTYEQEHGKPPSENVVKDAVSLTPRYIEFVDVMCQERRAWFDVTEQRDALNYKIRFLLKSDKQSVDTVSPGEDPVSTDDE
ncbi:hypothetical protein OAF34_04275 [Pirellulaceae bacterium]|nr:hypothetical protein [Pirellulaceae bacterium]